MKVIFENEETEVMQYDVIIHLPMYDDDEDDWNDDSMAYTTIHVVAASEEDAIVAGKRHIKNKKSGKAGRYWTNAEVISAVRAGE